MEFDQLLCESRLSFDGMPPHAFLLGLLSAFDNRYQAVADAFFKEVTWKQFFAIICINLCKESPTINELADIMGSSHQNVKQILLKLEKIGFVEMIPDSKDRRKQRIVLTKTCRAFCQRNDEESIRKMNRMFEGISKEQIIATIQTIIQMERNLKEL